VSICGGSAFERERDILDVWFDSGSSHEAVLARSPELGWPADMYLEGSDQHRGWFQSSLLVALATRGRPPYRELLTHGFLIDLEGRKMSKSQGNAISPQEVIKESGAEIIRLWVARPSSPRRSASARKSSRASSMRTGSCATRAGSSWPTCTISIPSPTA
jgi:isoleucyl-tRNA synthetase